MNYSYSPKERNIPNYLERIKIKSAGTVKNTKTYLNGFDKFVRKEYDKNNEDILSEIYNHDNQKHILYDLLQDFVNYLVERNVGSGAVRNYVYGLKGYLRYFGFDITKESLKDNVTLPRIIEEQREPLKFEQLKNIVESAKPRRKALYLTMSTSGIRPNEAMQLRKRDFDLEKYDRIMIRLPAKITKTRKPRVTFVTKETEQYLMPILKKVKDDDYVFSTNPDNPEQAKLNEEQVFSRIRDDLGYTEKYESGTHKITLGDSLRSWFVTRANRVDYGFEHALAGHDQYMKRYDRLSLDEMVELYKKLEPDLLLFEYNKTKLSVDKTTKQEIESLKKEIAKIKLREKVIEAMRQGMVEWSEKHPDQVHPLQMAKVNFGKSKSIDEMVEHFLNEHEGNIDGLRERFANTARVSLVDD